MLDEPTVNVPPLLSAENLVKEFPLRQTGLTRRKESIRAVDDVSFELKRGETLGIVGESGCGKSTLAELILRLVEPTSGRVVFNGVNVHAMTPAHLRRFRRDAQIIFQDPFESLNPRMTAGEIISDPWKTHKGLVANRHHRTEAATLMEKVGLRPEHIDRRPGQFSGGQRQRLGIARALAVNPEVIICDEPTSALDVSVQAQVLNLLADLKSDLGIAIVFISHDLSVVKHVSDRVAVMYLGRIVEIGQREAVFSSPSHPYAQALLSAVPSVEGSDQKGSRRIVLQGEIPSPTDRPSGCRFRTRCWKAEDVCAASDPPLLEHAEPGHLSACHFPG